MALKSSVYKVELTVSDTDRHHYATYPLTVACHPSETDGRMVLRLAAFALFAEENLAFTRGVSATDEPDVWQKDLTGAIEHWVELGWPDEKRLGKACGQSQQVTVVSYGRTAGPWWQPMAEKCQRYKNLRVLFVGEDAIEQLAPLAGAKTLSATISDGNLWLASDDHSVEIKPERWQ